MLNYCEKRLLSLHDFLLMKSHGDAPLLHICDVTWLNCTVMHLHRSETFEKLQASRISLLIYPRALRKFNLSYLWESSGGWEPSCYYMQNSTLSFNYWLLAAIIHYLIISFIHTYIYLYYYIFILFCSNF